MLRYLSRLVRKQDGPPTEEDFFQAERLDTMCRKIVVVFTCFTIVVLFYRARHG